MQLICDLPSNCIIVPIPSGASALFPVLSMESYAYGQRTLSAETSMRKRTFNLPLAEKWTNVVVVHWCPNAHKPYGVDLFGTITVP